MGWGLPPSGKGWDEYQSQRVPRALGSNTNSQRVMNMHSEFSGRTRTLQNRNSST